MTRVPVAAERGERGFILVGVVMFMLALTILGLSLFALSSYEAQFFYAAQSHEQSLQSAESGMELVKALLASPPNRLEQAGLAVGQFGITRAIAYQKRSGNENDTVSSGPVNWDSTLVIAVAARAGGEERMVQSKFVPLSAKNPYRQLFTAGSIGYNTSQGVRTIQARGHVWQPVDAASDTAWTAFVDWPSGRPLDPSAPPVPLANAFVDARRPGAPLPDDYAMDRDGTPYWIEFNNTSGSPKVYQSPPSPELGSGHFQNQRDAFEFFAEHDLELRIHGTVIWVVGQGVNFHQTVTVVPVGPLDPADPNVLVIVAKPKQNTSFGSSGLGIWFEAGLVNDPATTNVFLVSQGDITFTQDFNSNASLTAGALTLVAGGNLELMGPNSGARWTLAHPDGMDPIADNLVALGALPATTGGSGVTYQYAHATWKETRLP